MVGIQGNYYCILHCIPVHVYFHKMIICTCVSWIVMFWPFFPFVLIVKKWLCINNTFWKWDWKVMINDSHWMNIIKNDVCCRIILSTPYELMGHDQRCHFSFFFRVVVNVVWISKVKNLNNGGGFLFLSSKNDWIKHNFF